MTSEWPWKLLHWKLICYEIYSHYFCKESGRALNSLRYEPKINFLSQLLAKWRTFMWFLDQIPKVGHLGPLSSVLLLWVCMGEKISMSLKDYFYECYPLGLHCWNNSQHIGKKMQHVSLWTFLPPWFKILHLIIQFLHWNKE